MIPLDAARRAVLGGCRILAPRTVPLLEALGCALAEPARAAVAVPPFANSAMDGYAVRSADVTPAPATLAVVGRILAGSSPSVAVAPGQAARIMTGAPVPAGADAVCMVERTSPDPAAGGPDDDGRGWPARVVIEAAVAPGENIRPAGSDVEAGEVVLEAGSVIGPTQLAALVSAGCEEVLVHPRPRVGVLSTGDELVDAGTSLGGAQIYDSNRPMLMALVAEAGCAAVDLGRAPDEETALTGLLEGALGHLDAVVLSGGVSVGDVDLVKVVLDKLGGGSAQWMQIAIRPAKPFSFARLSDAGRSVPAFGLPGNPVSSAVGFELLVRPALRSMAGQAAIERQRVRAVAAEALSRRPDGKLHLVRVRLERRAGAPGAEHRPDGPEWLVRPCSGQGSHQIRSMAAADGLALVPDGAGVGAGESVEVLVTSPHVLAAPAGAPVPSGGR